MELSILGTLAVVDGDHEIPVPGLRLRTLLALLIVADGASVHPERLADDLWGDAIPAGAANALQSLVSKLRRTLADAGDLVVTDALGYRLAIAPEAVDARAFEQALHDGQAALAAGDAATAATVLADGLARWRGPALDGLADDGALRREALRLEELRVTALEERGDADLACGRHAEIVASLQQLTRAHPTRERFHGQLMLALYRSGRQAEALRAFQDARDMLADELGLDPGVELQTLEAAILAQDPSLVAAPPPATARARSSPSLTGGLSRFIGRVTEVETLGDLIDGQRLVTVVGPGGAGKTRLALEVASRRHGARPVWLVELAPLGDADAVGEAVAKAVGAGDGAMSDGVAAPVDRVIQHLGESDALLVLDNCEHVIAEAARVSERLLLACPGLCILVTSREALGIGGETIWPVPAMAIEDAVELFADRANASSGFALTPGTEASVNEVCIRLDGLPLAIELAAGRVRAIPVAQLASRLDDRFRLLTGGARTALPRQQTLRAVVEWSYDLLFDDERRVFERLGVFAGGCTLDAAEAVCAGDDIEAEDVPDLLAHLVEKSLVVADLSGGEVRYTLLQTLALFGRERLAASDGAGAARARHVAYFAELCDRGWPAFRGEQQVEWLTEVHREADNLRAAIGFSIDSGDAETALAMLGGLGWSYWFSGQGEEGWRLFVAALALPGTSRAETRASAAMWACYVGYAAGTGMDMALAYGVEAVALAREAGDERAVAEATMLLAGANIGAGHVDRAIELFDESHVMFSAYDDDWSHALSINAQGRAATLRGEVEEAERLVAESVRYFEAAGVEWAKALVNDDLAILAESRGDIEAATAGMEGARQAAIELELAGAEALFTARLGNYALIAGDIERAEALHTEALALGEAASFPRCVAFASNGRAMARRVEGRLDEAAEWAERARAMCHQNTDRMGEALSLASLGFIAERQGDFAQARTRHAEGLALARQMNEPVYLALALEGHAGLAAAGGDASGAAALLGAAHALRAQVGGAPAGPASDVDRITEAARALGGDDEFDASFARGAADPGAVLD